MLMLPEKGMVARSIDSHNINFEIFCDWIEGSILLTDGEISTTDIVDVLTENFIYDDQDFALSNVENAWSEIERRLSWLGDISNPINFTLNRATSKQNWQEIPAHVFVWFYLLLNGIRSGQENLVMIIQNKASFLKN